jgi:hypothetical protein
MTNYRTDAPFTIPINLLAPDSGFEEYFHQAINTTGKLGIAFVSTMNPCWARRYTLLSLLFA